MNQSASDGTSKDAHQVLLYRCPAYFPFSFAVHTWLVVNKKGQISRWEVHFRKTGHKTSWGHLHLNLLLPFQKLDVFPVPTGLFWKPKLLGKVEGDLAERMAAFIERSPIEYPYCHTYSLTGPNSNTYTEWILASFPESKLALPWNAIGKKSK